MFSKNFIAATKEYTTLEHHVPAPYLRKSFAVSGKVKASVITICGLGLYRLFVNGKDITKGLLAPYLSNPDHIMYYDRYDIAEYLAKGENVIGILLGNGLLNYPGGQVWKFTEASYRSAPKVALKLEVTYEDGRIEQITADESFKTHPSPIVFDDFRLGEFYDATKEVPGWNLPGFDDSDWSDAIPAEAPKGETKLCTAEPIVLVKKLRPIAIRKGCIGANRNMIFAEIPMNEEDKCGYIYDFGENLAGIVRIKVNGKKGQRISIQTGELLDNSGNLDLRGWRFAPEAIQHRMIYTLKGEGIEEYASSFTFYGMRYCLVSGITDQQATEELLTFEVMSSGLEKNGDFSCSDEVINKLQKATYNADISNFYYYPMDCPHREKNGWTGDAALSAEQMLFNLTPENSYRVWLDNIRKAQKESGELPGIIPNAGWGYSRKEGVSYNGPGWDCVIAYLPYYTWLYRGRTDLVEENADAMMKYLGYLKGQRDAQGLLELGLWDYVPICYKLPMTPLVTSSTLIAMDICEKCTTMFTAIGRHNEAAYADAFRTELRRAARKVLIEADGATVLGRNQSAQAMGISYGLFEPGEKQAAVEVLLRYIDKADGHMDIGVLGSRVLFHVLAQYGHADLAYRMIVGPEYPSYGHWIVYENCTALFEQFNRPEDPDVPSKNHHFWGDISSWFIKYLAGVKINPYARDVNELEISPNFVSELEHAGGYQNIPAGRIEVYWERTKKGVDLTVTIPEGCYGLLRLPDGYYIQERYMESIKRLMPGKTVYPLLWKVR